MTTSAAAALFQTPLAQYAHAQTNEMRLRASHEPVFPEHIRNKIDFVGMSQDCMTAHHHHLIDAMASSISTRGLHDKCACANVCTGGLNTPMHTYRRERAFKAQAVQGAAAGSSVMPGDGELSFTFLV